MFPLKNTEAYIHANGYRSTLGKELAARDAAISELVSENQALSNQLTAETTARQNADSNINEALTNEVTTRVVNGAHNLLEISATNETRNGITLIVNEDKTITLSTGSGGATALTQFRVNETTKFYPYGDFILTGCPVGGSLSTYDLRTSNDNDEHENKIDIGDGVSFSRSAGLEDGLWAIITIRAGQVLTPPITFKPMIRRASDIDPTYQPYAKTNVELTQDVAGLTTKSFIKITDNEYANEVLFVKSGTSKIVQISAPKGIAANTNVEIPIPSGYTSEVAIATGSLASFTSDFVISGGKIRMSINNAGKIELRSSIAITSAIDEVLYMPYV